jgi:death on curing protein
MTEPRWIDADELLVAHEEQIAWFGGTSGVRDIGLAESAAGRPRQLYHYGRERDLLALAVRLGVGLARNHPFLDGNKRTGAIAMLEMIELNGYGVVMDDDGRLGRWFEAAIEGRMSEDELADALWPLVREIWV